MPEPHTLPRIRTRRVRKPNSSPVQISAIHVEGLFGKLNYPTIPVQKSDDARGRVAVLYGDNGTGKTTILRLIFACLSWQTRIGLRTLLAKTPFRLFKIDLSDGTTISVEKPESIGDYVFKIEDGQDDKVFHIAADQDGNVTDPEAVMPLEAALRQLGFDVLFVDHNRVVQSTLSFLNEPHSSDDIFEISQKSDLVVSGTTVRLAGRNKDKDLQFPLLQVVEALNRRFRFQAYRQGAAGEQSAAALYLEITRSIMRDRRRRAAAPAIRDVVETLSDLKLSTQSFIKHGLLSEYPFDELISIYQKASKAKKAQIESVLTPFLDSIKRRLTALSEIHSRITVFEDEFSNYSRDKMVSFVVPDGLTIYDQLGQVEIDSLSSGEKQLVFLLCSAAVARSRRSIIIIDEPELSLNYKWQRLIAGSLSRLSSGGDTQYILASHSIEIITRYVDSSFELVR